MKQEIMCGTCGRSGGDHAVFAMDHPFYAAPVVPDTAAPPVLTVPWHFVQHDNHRLMPGRHRRLITSPLYRQAKESAEISIKQQWRGCPRLAGAIRLTARCYFPDNRRRDAGNYRKLVTDAMSGICYDDDAQLESETWEKAGIDKENARIEITIGALEPQITGTLRGAAV